VIDSMEWPTNGARWPSARPCWLKKVPPSPLDRAFRLAPEDPSLLFDAALVHVQFDELDEALRFLTKCRAAGFPQPKIRDYPNFQSLHSDPQFQQLLRSESPTS
jgi:hypothetical protein